MINLFKHNETAYKAAVTMLSERGKAAVVHPTGTGKSFIGFKLCEDNPDKTILWLSPSRYIYQTQLENLTETSDGYQPENVIFYTYAKLMNIEPEEIETIDPDYIILDEFHRCGAELWGAGVKAVLSVYPDIPVLGLSATAIRYLDNQRNMTDELFDGNIASEMTLGEAIVRNILSPPKYILSIFSYQQDLEKYEKRVHSAKSKAVQDAATAYLDALKRALDKADKLDILFEKHMTDRTGKYIVFCANYDHMLDMMGKAKEWFWRVDRKPHLYSVYSDDPTASKSFTEFKADTSNHLKLLYCIDALNEGVHVPDISGVILLRPTISPIIYKQQIGRALSASKNRSPVIFDIVNNIESLYSIDAIEEEMQVAIQYYRSHGGDGFVVNESFELIDKVADCKALFDELEGTLSASWDLMYEQAVIYHNLNGNLDVPKRYFTPEGYSLGLWILTQRRVYNGTVNGNLTQVQIDKLNALGMRWESAADVTWEKYYNAAKAYYEAHGDLKPQAVYIDENGVDLGRWIAQIRVYRKSGIKSRMMSSERIAALDKIGMIWSVPDYLFETNYAAAVRYHREHGNLDVPFRFIDSEGIHLGQWLVNIRTSRNKLSKRSYKLTDEQIARLDALGMIWGSKYDKQWDDAFQALLDYQKLYGTLDVPFSFKTESGIALGKWTRRQRDFYANGRLSNERIAKLKAIGFILEKSDPWEEKYQLAKSYYEEHGDLNVPKGYIVNGVWLQKWLNEQKQIAEGKRKKQLKPEQLSKLTAIGFRYGATFHEEQWNKRYKLAKSYFEEHGDLNVPKDYVIADFQLGVWTRQQKAQYKAGTLSQERYDLLTAIGMDWGETKAKQISDAYKTGFQHLEAFIKAHGVDALTGTVVCEDGYKLGTWYANCKVRYRKGKLPQEHIDHFQQLGVQLRKSGDSWSDRYHEVKAYLEEHDTTCVPKGTISDSGYNLYSWIAEQRKAYKSGKLSEAQMKMLDAIGYPFRSDRKARRSITDAQWMQSYQIALEYSELHPGEHTPKTLVYKGVYVSRWVMNQQQRYKKGELSPERIELLKKIQINSISFE